ncbi:hypothetical protein [Dyadobacter flavalbus]|nr:hypothetical protein [Dyadobacter flavalbus]
MSVISIKVHNGRAEQENRRRGKKDRKNNNGKYESYSQDQHEQSLQKED